MPSEPSKRGSGKKELGAFYTPAEIAEKLVRWAVREPEDRALDPSFGGMVFVEQAYDRLLELGVAPEQGRTQLHGCELDQVAFEAAGEGTLRLQGMVQGDFLAASVGAALPEVEAVVGNPPYVRYQLCGEAGDVGRRIAREAGVALTAMSSSWAPFVVHATAFVKKGGRMALVLPAELLHAQYAGEVRRFLQEQFGKVILALFEERIFPGVTEEVVFLLAEGRGGGPAGGLEVIQYERLADFDVDGLLRRVAPEEDATEMHANLLAQLLPEATRELLKKISADRRVKKLGAYAEVDIGTVTGANDYFLLKGENDEGIAPELLQPIISRAAHLPGARFTAADYEELADRGVNYRLLALNSDAPAVLRQTAEDYLRRGGELGISRRYKCRQRDDWWSVPIPGTDGRPDLFLTYCAAEHPRLVVNEARLLHTNAVHGVRLKKGGLAASSLAAGFFNSLTLLSAELEGRSYGGGVLKLEPSEAESVVLPPLGSIASKLSAVDVQLRDGSLADVLDIVDQVVLGKGLGLAKEEIASLRIGAEKLRSRRRARKTSPLADAA
jgi:adenine-specific DNA-methyltransferase